MRTRVATPQQFLDGTAMIFTAGLSMTNCLTNYVRGVYTIEDMRDAHFFFGCSREHVFGNPGRWPTEASWCNEDMPKRYTEGDGVRMPYATISPSLVDPKLRPVVESFMLLLEEADKAGRIQWRVHPYDIIRKLHPNTDVLWEGHTHKASYWQEENDE